METTYRGYTIVYDEVKKEFRTESDEHGTLKHADLAGLKKAIDRKEDEPEEKAKKQPKQDALELDINRWGNLSGLLKGYKPVKLGAFGNLVRRYGSDGLAVWKYTGYKDRTRERESIESSTRHGSQFVKDTPENRTALDTIIMRAKNLEKYVADELEGIKTDVDALERSAPAIPAADLPTWER